MLAPIPHISGCISDTMEINHNNIKDKPVAVAAQSKALVRGRSPTEIVGSNTAGGSDVCRECCVLSGRGLCGELITLPGESYRLWCVVVCDLETS